MCYCQCASSPVPSSSTPASGCRQAAHAAGRARTALHPLRRALSPHRPRPTAYASTALGAKWRSPRSSDDSSRTLLQIGRATFQRHDCAVRTEQADHHLQEHVSTIRCCACAKGWQIASHDSKALRS
eukprot:6186615-Pleurochrysis_carterae.AAC.1